MWRVRACIIILLAGVLLAGCGESEPEQPAPPAETVAPVQTVQETAAQPTITATASPAATSTVTETSVPAPTTTPTAEPTLVEADTSPATATTPPQPVEPTLEEFAIPSGSHPHDVAPAPDGSVWYTARLRVSWGGWTRPVAKHTISS